MKTMELNYGVLENPSSKFGSDRFDGWRDEHEDK